MLGTEACGDMAVPLRMPEQPGQIPGPTQARKEKAHRLADAVLEVIRLAPPAGAKQAGFTITRCVVAHAFDYDAGVLTCSALLPHAN